MYKTTYRLAYLWVSLQEKLKVYVTVFVFGNVTNHVSSICWGVPAQFHGSLISVKDFLQLSAQNGHLR